MVRRIPERHRYVADIRPHSVAFSPFPASHLFSYIPVSSFILPSLFSFDVFPPYLSIKIHLEAARCPDCSAKKRILVNFGLNNVSGNNNYD